MSEKKVRGSEMSMSEATLVNQARSWTEGLCKDEERGHADFLGAMERVARRLRIPFGFLKELVYRPPKRISAGRFLTLAAAHDERLRRQSTQPADIAFTPSTALGRTLLNVADALDRAADTLDS
jgi:hypothetical protein